MKSMQFSRFFSFDFISFWTVRGSCHWKNKIKLHWWSFLSSYLILPFSSVSQYILLCVSFLSHNFMSLFCLSCSLSFADPPKPAIPNVTTTSSMAGESMDNTPQTLRTTTRKVQKFLSYEYEYEPWYSCVWSPVYNPVSFLDLPNLGFTIDGILMPCLTFLPVYFFDYIVCLD